MIPFEINMCDKQICKHNFTENDKILTGEKLTSTFLALRHLQYEVLPSSENTNSGSLLAGQCIYTLHSALDLGNSLERQPVTAGSHCVH